MKSTVKNILGSIIFLFGLLVLLIVSSLIFRPKNNTYAAGMEEQEANGILAEEEHTIDVLFIGDSVSYCSVMPMQIWKEHGITSYVCATSLQQLHYSKEFLQKTFEKQSPKVVMMEGAPLFNNFMYKENISNAIQRVLPVFRYHDRWKDFLKNGAVDDTLKVEYTNRELNKGYYFSVGVDAAENPDYAKLTEKTAGVLEDCKQTMVEMAEFCKKNGAEFILWSAPNTLTWTPDGHNAIQKVADELGVTYIDTNYMKEEVPIDWEQDTFDKGDHLNYFGAKKVTTYLGSYLKEKNLFVDKRADGRYEVWNEEQKRFYQTIIQ